MNGGQGLTANTPQGVVSSVGVTPPGASTVLGDPSSFVNDPGNFPGGVVGSGDDSGTPLDRVTATGQRPAGDLGSGLHIPTYPDLTSMGGGQGLTVDTGGAITGALGTVPDGASVILGDPNSFINDPTILGNTVIGPDTILHPDGTGTNTVTEPKTTSSTTNNTNSYSFNNAARKNEFMALPDWQLAQLAFDPALMALLNGRSA